jgi:UDPglucose 6-dehydrogenase
LIANAFLAQKISSINAASQICEMSDADIQEVARAIGTDTRIGPHFLNASVGFGGSCFKKDILNLVYIARSFGLTEVADYWNMVVRINEVQKSRFVRKMVSVMFNTVAGKKIALLGFAFKANTGDTRESAAIGIAQQLLEERAVLAITDPRALENARMDLEGVPGQYTFHSDPYQAVEDASALAVITEWDEYRNLDYRKIYQLMKKPAFLFDGRNILDHKQLFTIGFNVYPLGKQALSHLK